MTSTRGKPRKQVAAVPVAQAEDGSPLVMLITSRQTKRFIVPKGWPMSGKSDPEAAQVEAMEEAGVVGRADPNPIGSYLAWKRGAVALQVVRVTVYLLDVDHHLDDWREKGERSIAWLHPRDASTLVAEPGLSRILRDLPHRLPTAWQTRTVKPASQESDLGGHPVIRLDGDQAA